MSQINRHRLRRSKRGCVTLAVVFGALIGAHASQISVNLGPAPHITSHVGATFSTFDGTHLNGQTLSLDFSFANNEFARLFSVTNPSFEVLVTLQTSASRVVGFLNGTGYLLGQYGTVLGPPQFLGSASGNDGSMSAGMFPLLSGEFAPPLDFYGTHFNLLLPNSPRVTITGGELQLLTPGEVPNDVFGIGPGVPANIVPDSGNTVLLLSAAVVLMFVAARRFARVS
ncbi:MAG: hypothetical protein JO354_13960 [Verrucomicrobia bacterium]|nr:hypothetical protein [Verrucomicrobiota bacterium]